MLSSRSRGSGTEIVVARKNQAYNLLHSYYQTGFLCRKTKHQSNHSTQSEMTQWECSEPIKTPSKYLQSVQSAGKQVSTNHPIGFGFNSDCTKYSHQCSNAKPLALLQLHVLILLRVVTADCFSKLRPLRLVRDTTMVLVYQQPFLSTKNFHSKEASFSHPLDLLDQECLHQSVWISFSCFSSCLLVSSLKIRVLPTKLTSQKMNYQYCHPCLRASRVSGAYHQPKN